MGVEAPIGGRQWGVQWQGPKIHPDYKKIQEAREQGQEEFEKRDAAENELITRIANQSRPQAKTQSYAMPGTQGVLGEVGGEELRPPEPDWLERPIAEHSEAEKATRVSEIAKHLGIPMQPGRQVASFANRQHLPKKEGGQGTLFSVGRYRP